MNWSVDEVAPEMNQTLAAFMKGRLPFPNCSHAPILLLTRANIVTAESVVPLLHLFVAVQINA